METNQTFEELAQVVEHELFPDVDLALRRGRHVDREDAAWYGFLTDAQALLEVFYRRYGAELVQRTDGFFFLLPSGDKLGRRHLSPSEMLVGQGLTLLYLEPATVEQGGITSRDQLLSQLSASMGTEQLMLAFNAKKKRLDERVAEHLADREISVGDFVDLGGHSGTVESMTIRSVRVRDSSGSVHIIPFSAVSTVVNMTKEFAYAVFNLGVAYEDDVDRASAVMQEVGRDLQQDPAFKAAILSPIEVLGIDSFTELRWITIETQPGHNPI